MSDREDYCRTDPFGFTWGPLHVKRVALVRGSRVLRVETDAGQTMAISVSPTGRSLRVWRNGWELRVADDGD